jgi:membrane protein DedA with SNARE-associated domain
MGSVLHALSGLSSPWAYLLIGLLACAESAFLPCNIAGGLTWAPAVVSAGYPAGGSYQQVHRLAGAGWVDCPACGQGRYG